MDHEASLQYRAARDLLAFTIDRFDSDSNFLDGLVHMPVVKCSPCKLREQRIVFRGNPVRGPYSPRALFYDNVVAPTTLTQTLAADPWTCAQSLDARAAWAQARFRTTAWRDTASKRGKGFGAVQVAPSAIQLDSPH